MTRAELHNLPGFHPDTIKAAVAHLRANPKRPNAALRDATSIINNEGWLNGYTAALEDLLAALSPKAEEKLKPQFQPYAQPSIPNQNKE